MQKEETKKNIIGKLYTVNNEKLIEWLKSDERAAWCRRNWSDKMPDWESGEKIDFYRYADRINGLSDACDNIEKSYFVDKLIDVIKYNETFGNAFELIYFAEEFVVFSDAKDMYILPARFCKTELFKDYNSASLSDLHLIGGGDNRTSLYPATEEDNVSVNSIQDKIEAQKKNLENKQAEIEELKKEQEAELEALKRELEEKYRERRELLESKMDELNAVKEEMEKQIFMLESEIYAIRCYTGEVVDFKQIVSGKPADIKEPVIIYQKLRFMDEELGKLASMYDVAGTDNNLQYFEDVIKAREDIRELFVPSEKCISMIKISKTGIGYTESDKFANMLKSYEKYHGSKLAIIIRNGENIYIGWTDEEKIKITDGNMFFVPKEDTAVSADEKVNSSTGEDMLSRYFIFSLLQGICDTGKIITLPEKINVTIPNPYIVFSAADGWIEDNTYGSFADIIKETEAPLKKGDFVLTTQRVTRDDIYERRSIYSQASIFEKYNNNRGRGDKNRTHDVSIADCTVYPINLVDVTTKYEITYLEYPYTTKEKVEKLTETHTTSKYEPVELQGPPKICKFTTDIVNNEVGSVHVGKTYEDKGAFFSKHCRLFKNCFIKPDIDSFVYIDGVGRRFACFRKYVGFTELETTYEYFISEAKEANWRTGVSARANMQIFENECLNLTYLNSVFLRYAITNKKVDSWCIGGRKVDYAYAIRYLNKALEYLDKREKEERAMLESYMELKDGWQVELSRWRKEHGYHTLTPTRAKAFAKEVK